MYGLPDAYTRRAYAVVTYYYCSGVPYYPYYINGKTVYVKTTVASGVPVVPPRPS